MKTKSIILSTLAVGITAIVFYACQKDQTHSVNGTTTNEESVMQRSAMSALPILNERFIMINSRNEATEVTVTRGRDGIVIINTNGGRITSNKPLEAKRSKVYDGDFVVNADETVSLVMPADGIKDWYIDFEPKIPVIDLGNGIIGGGAQKCNCKKELNGGETNTAVGCNYASATKDCVSKGCSGTCGFIKAGIDPIGLGDALTYIAISSEKLILNGKVYE